MMGGGGSGSGDGRRRAAEGRAVARRDVRPVRRGRPSARCRSSRSPAFPIEPLYTPEDLRGLALRGQARLPGRVPVHARAVSVDVPRAALDHADVRGLRAARGHQRALQVPARAGADGALHGLRHARPHGLRRRPPARPRRGGQARACRSRRSPTSSCSSADIPLDRVTTSMTINCTASVALAMYLALADKQGVSWDRVGGTMQNDMLKEFIAQKEWISPARVGGAHRGGHHRVLHAARAALQPRVDLRLPHPRGGLDGGAGAGLHPRRRLRLRRRVRRSAASTSTPSRRACQLLLRHPQRLLRGDRQAAGGPAHLGHRDAGPLRGDASPSRCGCARTRRPRACRPPPSSRSTTWRGSPSRRSPRCSGGAQSLHTNSYDEVLALPTEEAVTVALRTQQIIAEETGATAHHRSARRLVLPRGAHRPDGSAGDGLHPDDRRAGRHRARPSTRAIPQKEIADAAYRYQLMDDRGEQGRGRRQQVRDGRREADGLPHASTRRSSGSRSSACGAVKAAPRRRAGGEAPEAARRRLPAAART